MQTIGQKLIVSPDGNLEFEEQVFKCALGRSGRGLKKTEGDGITPIGSWLVRRVLYRPDRLEKPVCKLPLQALSPGDGWCDDPEHGDYNQFVQLPHPASCENLWRADHAYDLIVTLGYNDDPVVAGSGSAIFFHVAKDNYKPTEGCVAIREEELLFILARLEPDCRMEILAES